MTNDLTIPFCIARIEAQIAIQTLLQRMPNLQWCKLIGFRSLNVLPINFS